MDSPDINEPQNVAPSEADTSAVALDDDMLVGPSLRRTLMLIYEDHARTFGGGILTPQRFAVMRFIARQPGLKQSDVASRLGIARSGAMVLVNALEDEGLVRRESHATDKRANGLAITRKGHAAMRKFTQQVASHDVQLLQNVDEHDRALFFDVLHRIAENAANSASSGAAPSTDKE